MGDRRNIIVEFNDKNSVALYTHWDGYRAHEALAQALGKRDRWDDPSYLTRIIFDTLVGGDTGTTGYGIEPFTTGSADYCEASPGYDLIVRPKTQTVEGDDSGEGTVHTFDEFIAKFSPESALA